MRPCLAIREGEPVGLHLAPPQPADFTGTAAGEQDQPHRRHAHRPRVLKTAERRLEPRQIVRAQEPTAWQAPEPLNPRAGVPRRRGSVAPVDGADEHRAQNVVAPVGPARPAPAVGMQPARQVGARDRGDAELAESRQDRAVEVGPDRRPDGRSPGRRAALQVFGREPCQGRAGYRRGYRPTRALLARQERERRCPGLVHVDRFRPAQGDAAGTTIPTEAQNPRPCALRLDPQSKPRQRDVANPLLALARPGRQRQGIGQAGPLRHCHSSRARAWLQGGTTPDPLRRTPAPRQGGHTLTSS